MLRRVVKRAITSSAQLLGLNRLFRYQNRNHLLVLCYHGVLPDEAVQDPFLCRYAVTVSDFAAQVRFLKQYFQPVSAEQVVAAAGGKQRLPSRSVLVTFDDGLRNQLIVAAPILQSHSIPAAFHVTTNSIETGRPIWPLELGLLISQWPSSKPMPHPEQPNPIELADSVTERLKLTDVICDTCLDLDPAQRREYLQALREESGNNRGEHDQAVDVMSWDELRELRSMGFTIGSHTVSHPRLSRTSVDEVNVELRESKRTIERELDQSCDMLAYPYGGLQDYSSDVVQAARAAGYKIAFSVNDRHWREEDALEIPRVIIDSSMAWSEWSCRVSGFYECGKRWMSNSD